MRRTQGFAAALTAALLAAPAGAINITVDYSYDINGFFTAQPRRDALQAAADRFSVIITTSLDAVTLSDTFLDPRIGFTHPGNGQSWQVSAAGSQVTDSLADPLVVTTPDVADEYRGAWSIAQDEWILYAGGRPLSSAGIGGTGTGLNFTSVFEDGASHLNRGFRASGSVGSLPMWGGAIAFDNSAGRNWHFDLDTEGPSGSLDFYSIALHEIGHALGLSTTVWDDWSVNTSGNQYNGSNAVAAYNADNGASASSLNLVSASNAHWEDGTYESTIFNAGNPNYVGTVGAGSLQDLLMEPTANFIFPSLRRFELTNVDVAALEDIGWSVIEATPTQDGDYDGDGSVDASDYIVWRDALGSASPIGSFAEWSANFGAGSSTIASGVTAAVPEPPTAALMACLALTAATAASRSGRV